MTAVPRKPRHVQAVGCGFDVSRPGTTEVPRFDGACGYERDAAVHDLHPDVSKRDRLPVLMTERDRHAFVPGKPYGQCEYDRDSWPCDAAQLAEALTHAEQRTRDLEAALRKLIAAAEWSQNFVVDEPGNGPIETWHRGMDKPLREARAAIEEETT